MSDDFNSTVLAALESLKEGQSRADAGLKRLEEAQIESAERLEDRLVQFSVDLMTRIDRLQNDITEMRDHITVNFGSSDAAKRINENTREEVRALGEQVNAMYRLIRRLETEVRDLRDKA